MNVIGMALEELYRIFDILNRDKFNGELTAPVITIQKTKGNILEHFTTSKVWVDKNNKNNKNDEESEETSYYEINIDPRWFNSRTPADVVETLLHEMCHYYNKANDIKDCSGNVHNKKFKSSAERVGLIVEKGKGIGYGYTSMSEALKAYVDEIVQPIEAAFEYFRSVPMKSSGDGGTRKKTMFKYTCPDCGAEVKGKKDMAIKCGHCDVLMKMKDEETGAED